MKLVSCVLFCLILCTACGDVADFHKDVEQEYDRTCAAPVITVLTYDITDHSLTYYLVARITCATPYAFIRYTVDGTEPSSINGFWYHVDEYYTETYGMVVHFYAGRYGQENITTIKAIAHRETYNDSPVTTLNIM
jgi:hypothetical protein